MEIETNEDTEIKFNKSTFIQTTKKDLLKQYQIIKQIGKGGYGKVYLVTNLTTGENLACKQIPKTNKNLEKTEREIAILKNADHPNIVKLYSVYEDKHNFYLIMENLKGGELFDKIIERIKKKNIFSEYEAAQIFKQIISVISYCHSKNIVHRDLKPENILFTEEDNDINNNTIKIIDFGLSRKFTRNKLSSPVGTCYYVAPEILIKDYSEKCDIWSAGVILYILLSGEPPFNGSNNKSIYYKISTYKYNFPENKWNNISNEAKDLISKILVPEDQRISADDILNHEWFKKVEVIERKNLNFDIEKFNNYVQMNKLKKMVFTFITSRLDDIELNDIKNTFLEFDSNKDGMITLEEFKNGLIKLNIGTGAFDIQNMFNEIDTDKNGVIDYTEFLSAAIEQNKILKERKLFEAFQEFDVDGTGKISKDDILKVLKLERDFDGKIEEMIKEVDKNGDGEIDYMEFLNMMGYNYGQEF